MRELQASHSITLLDISYCNAASSSHQSRPEAIPGIQAPLQDGQDLKDSFHDWNN